MKKVGLIFTLTVTCNNLLAQAPDTLWTKTFGGRGDETAYAVCQTSDGGFIIVGSTNSFGAGDDDVWLIRTDDSGNMLWSKTFGGIYWDAGYSVQQTSDGGFIFTGGNYTGDSSSGNLGDVWLIKTDANGDTLWTKSFGTNSSSEVGNSVQQTLDNGYVITGTFGGEGPHVFLIRTDTNGDLLWIKRYESQYTGDVECRDSGNFVQQTSDGGFIIAGIIGSYLDTRSDFWLIRTDPSGDTLWTRRFGGVGDDEGNSVQQTLDGGFIITGTSRSVAEGRSDVWLIRTDTNGDTLWTKAIGGKYADRGYSIQLAPDGGYIIVGSTGELFGTRRSDLWLIRTDANGDTLWTKTIGGNESDDGYSIRRTFEGGYIITGNTRSYGAGEYDIWLIRLTPESSTGVQNREFTNFSTYEFFQNYPNPFNPTTTIEFTLPKSRFVTLKVFNIYGEEVATLVAEKLPAGKHQRVWEANKLASGVYVYRLEAGEALTSSGRGVVQTRKLLLLR